MAAKRRKRAYWFPVKSYGSGWGAPDCWQGWVAFAAWVAVTVTGSMLIALGVIPPVVPYEEVTEVLIFVAGMTVVLGGLCHWKGQRPVRWRWGEKEIEGDDVVCDQCGYNLTGNVSGVCPECGERTSPSR